MEINRVGVLGCGLMGSGIAQTAASAGCEVVVREVTDELCERGFKGIDKSLAKFAEKGTITADQQTEIRRRIRATTALEDLADCDIIVEAIVRNSTPSATHTTSSTPSASPKPSSPRTPRRSR